MTLTISGHPAEDKTLSPNYVPFWDDCHDHVKHKQTNKTSTRKPSTSADSNQVHISSSQSCCDLFTYFMFRKFFYIKPFINSPPIIPARFCGVLQEPIALSPRAYLYHHPKYDNNASSLHIRCLPDIFLFVDLDFCQR